SMPDRSTSSTPKPRRLPRSGRHAPRAVRGAVCCQFSQHNICALRHKPSYGTRSVPATLCNRLRQREMQIISVTEPRPFWIVRNIALKCLELLETANEVIEGLFLPESATSR